MATTYLSDVFHLITGAGPTSIPYELARHLRDEGSISGGMAVYFKNEPGMKSPAGMHELKATKPLDPAAIRKLRAILQKERPRILHVHHSMASLVAIAASVGLGCKIVKTEHHHRDDLGFRNKLIAYPTQLLASAIVCNSAQTMASFSPWERVLLGSKLQVIHNGIDLDLIQSAAASRDETRKAMGFDPSSYVIGSLGRLVREKDYPTLVSAFAMARESIPNAKLAIVGAGYTELSLKSQIQSLGIADHVCLTGGMNRIEAYRHLHAFDLFVMPSVSEGFCNAVAEAMGAGLPLICSDIPTLREVAGDTARFFKVSDPTSLTNSIVETRKSEKQHIEKTTCAAFQKTKNKYSLEVCVANHIKLYQKIISSLNER